ncbi:MFS transporter [Parageobacillus thermoglucosidasius]|uniref:MFS transporter n=1 Tax=Parageobacillus thermoglucosidasius TaxID=1426 RepID=UPI000E19ABC6|nr:MFS transporter [Parageobacillus thermoglucosidasius]MED4905696.1 MFS transporter [Parageobacillus thermoglucosidasius]MED4914082.1 MFS transporter [Parageobacillus thermoglucosidasius]MED4945683.1 MFS transporter [Parageobacillus thermoglucosidasius]MED4981388.1 MFS transporter [Parageobacillus thermoglucosidasius]RDE31409.1 MFS transporter [Parageobacillus thermoglucosidasius]
MTYIEIGTREYKKASLALFFGGFVTFAILYTTQPLLPVFAKEFHVSAASASLTVSVSTGTLAVMMLIAASLSDRVGKKKVMMISMLLTSMLALAMSFSPNFISLVLARMFLGMAAAGIPSLAMAYVAEEFHPAGIGKVMGLYISGTSLGGMAGRILTGLLTDLFSWRTALFAIGIISLLLSLIFALILPAPRHSVNKPLNGKTALRAYAVHLHNKPLMALIVLGFLFMGGFVTLYNYIGFLLGDPPYSFSQSVLGFLFIVYLFGSFSSVYMGKKADLYGHALVLSISVALTALGAVVTLVPSVVVKIIGLSLFTFGFFGCHSIASAWIGECANVNKAQASSLYLLFYYLGSSLAGTAGGYFWTHFHWLGVITFIVILLLLSYPLISYAHKHLKQLPQ